MYIQSIVAFILFVVTVTHDCVNNSDKIISAISNCSFVPMYAQIRLLFGYYLIDFAIR